MWASRVYLSYSVGLRPLTGGYWTVFTCAVCAVGYDHVGISCRLCQCARDDHSFSGSWLHSLTFLPIQWA